MPVANWARKQVLLAEQAGPVVFQVPFACVWVIESVPSDKVAYYLLLETLQQNSIFLLQIVNPDCYGNRR